MSTGGDTIMVNGRAVWVAAKTIYPLDAILNASPAELAPFYAIFEVNNLSDLIKSMAFSGLFNEKDRALTESSDFFFFLNQGEGWLRNFLEKAGLSTTGMTLATMVWRLFAVVPYQLPVDNSPIQIGDPVYYGTGYDTGYGSLRSGIVEKKFEKSARVIPGLPGYKWTTVKCEDLHKLRFSWVYKNLTNILAKNIPQWVS